MTVTIYRRYQKEHRYRENTYISNQYLSLQGDETLRRLQMWLTAQYNARSSGTMLDERPWLPIRPVRGININKTCDSAGKQRGRRGKWSTSKCYRMTEVTYIIDHSWMVRTRSVMQSFNVVLLSDKNVSETADGVLPAALYASIAAFLFVVMVIGTLVNGAVIYVFATHTGMKTSSNVFVFALCICGFLISTLGIPFAAASCLAHTWLFGRAGCAMHAALITGLGITMIAILTAIAVDRYIFIVRYATSHKLSRQNVTCMIVGCFMYGCTWSIFPLVGWSSYTEEIARVSCSVDWDTRGATNVSYSICLMTAGLILPMCIIGYLYTRIMTLVSTLYYIPYFHPILWFYILFW